MIEHEKIELFIPDASYGNSAHHLNLSEQEASNRFKEDLRSALEEFEKTSSEIKLKPLLQANIGAGADCTPSGPVGQLRAIS